METDDHPRRDIEDVGAFPHPGYNQVAVFSGRDIPQEIKRIGAELRRFGEDDRKLALIGGGLFEEKGSRDGPCIGRPRTL